MKETRFIDPISKKETSRKTEIRLDPLTKRQVRILEGKNFNPTKPDLADLIKKSLDLGCPFCSENLDSQTPTFPSDIIPEGRIRKGEAILFCNAFPYEEYSAVCAITKKHFIPLNEFDKVMLSNAFQACQEFIKYIFLKDPEAKFSSINWNYMPTAGASLIHPHLQPIVGTLPTNYQKSVFNNSLRYITENGRTFWEDLIVEEKKLDERFIGVRDNVYWIASYAPKGVSEIIAILPNRICITDLSNDDWDELCIGLLNTFAYLHKSGYHSFNLSIFSERQNSAHFRVNLSIVPRLNFSAILGTNEINYFHIMHNESLTRIKPEEICYELKAYFNR